MTSWIEEERMLTIRHCPSSLPGETDLDSSVLQGQKEGGMEGIKEKKGTLAKVKNISRSMGRNRGEK